MFLKSRILGLIFLFLPALAFADPTTYSIGEVIGTGNINIRKSVSELNIISGRTKPGSRYAIERKGQWYILLDGPYAGGCIHQEYVKVTREKYAILRTHSTKIQVHSSSDLKSSVIGSMDSSFLFAGTQEGNTFKVQDGPFRGGYISSEFARFLDKSDEANTALPVKSETAEPAKAETPEKKWSNEEEQRFQDQVEKAFKKKKQADQKVDIIVPVVYISEKPVQMGTITATIINETEAQVGVPFFEIMKKLIVAEWFEKPAIKEAWNKAFQNRELISLKVFENSGAHIKYDEKKLTIEISIPPDLRSTTTASLGKNQSGSEENAEPPAGFSTFLNISAAETIDTRSVSYNDRRNPFNARLENGTNILGVALEANGTYIENRGSGQENSGFTREDVRLVKDWPSANTRFSLGDVIYPVRTFQTYKPMGGFSATTNFSLNNSKLTYPTGTREVYLQHPSKVYVWVNDQMHQILDLPAGRHTLQDFPFTTGMNDVRLEIVDDTGRTETIQYSQFSSTELLKPGLNQFSYSYGSPWHTENKNRVYDSSSSIYSAFHKYGLTESLTVGGNVQGDSNQSILGMEATMATDIGYFRIEPAFSQGYSQTGFANQIQYSYVDYLGVEKSQRTYNLSLTTKSEKFASLGTILGETENPAIAEISAGNNRGLSKTLSLNLGGSYKWNRPVSSDTVDSYMLNAGLNKRFPYNINVSMSARHSHSERGADELGVWLFVLWTEPTSHQTVTATHSAADDSNRVDWNYNPSSGADSASYTASFHNDKDTQGYSGQMNYNGNRFRGSVQHEVIITAPNATTTTTDPSATTPTTTPTNSKKSDHVTTLQFATSLAYANGYFGIGRPILDSFAIFAPVKNLKGEVIDVNPDKDDNYVAQSGWLGAAVLPEMGSYNTANIVLGGKRVKNAAGLPRDHFDLKPTYKSGYGFGIGTDATMYLSAKLILPDSTPLENATASAIYLDDPQVAPTVVFTNRKGQLRSEGFRHGKYRLEVGDNQFQAIEFTIGESPENIFDLGTVQLKPIQ